MSTILLKALLLGVASGFAILFLPLALFKSRTTELQWKKCIECDWGVPLSSEVGGSCPHCGAVWTGMETIIWSEDDSRINRAATAFFIAILSGVIYGGFEHYEFTRPFTLEEMANPRTIPLPQFIERLITTLESEDEQTRQAAVEAIVTIGSAAVPALRTELRTGESDSRMVIHTMGRIGPVAKDAHPDIARALGDGTAEVRIEAFKAMISIQPENVTTVLAALQSDYSDIRALAVSRLAMFNAHASTIVPKLAKALSDENPLVRVAACKSLAQFAQNEDIRRAVISELIAKLSDSNVEVHQAAAEALDTIGPPSSEFTVDLIELLGQQDENVTSVSRRILASMESPGIEQLDKLIPFLKSSDDLIRDTAQNELIKMGTNSDEAFLNLISRPKNEVSNQVILTAVQKRGESAIPLLGKLLLDERSRSFALRTLFDIDKNWAASAVGKPAVSDIILLLQTGPNQFRRMEAAKLLRSIRPDPRQVVPALIASLDDEGEQVRKEAAISLGFFGVESEEAIPVLERIIEKEHFTYVKKAASDSLKSIRKSLEDLEKEKLREKNAQTEKAREMREEMAQEEQAAKMAFEIIDESVVASRPKLKVRLLSDNANSLTKKELTSIAFKVKKSGHCFIWFYFNTPGSDRPCATFKRNRNESTSVHMISDEFETKENSPSVVQ